MSRLYQLGDLQLAIMGVLWARNEASAGEVHQALLAERGLALTTIKTMLRKMDAKGVVTHRTEGRTFVYRADMAEAAVRRGMVRDIVARLFDGDGKALVNHLIQSGEVDASALEDLQAKVSEKRRVR